MSSYQAFLAAKMRAPAPVGLSEIPKLPKVLKAFQRDIVAWALKQGRCAIFAGTGLGKTAMQLAWADAVQKHAGASVLILTPLAVAQQTVQEAAKFKVAGVAYAQDQAAISSRIVVTNYDRIEKFDLSEFAGIVLDESGLATSTGSHGESEFASHCAWQRWMKWRA